MSEQHLPPFFRKGKNEQCLNIFRRDLVFNLNQALTAYHGEFRKPAQQLLAYASQMQGKIAFDRLDFAAASGYFSEMIDLGQELYDSDIVTLGMVYHGIEIVNYYADTGEWHPLTWFLSAEQRKLVNSENERIQQYRKKGDLL